MSSNPILVVGASRGIGAELVRQYLAAGHAVHATVRDISSVGELSTIEGDLTLHELGVRDVDATNKLAAALSGAELAVVIHNAGIMRDHPRSVIMEVNAEAPLRMTEALLAAGALRKDGILVLMTSHLGSRQGRADSLGDYGDSKAALNDGLRERAADWRERGVIAVVVHPGWVRTDMGGPEASLSVEESVTGIRSLVAGLGPNEHGRFWAWNGAELPW